MGFYDEFEQKPRRASSAPKWVAVILVSALAGSGTTAAVIPTLIKKQLNQQVSTATATTPAGAAQSVSYQVNTDIVSAVNKVKPAVVAVVNKQIVQDPFNLTSQQRDAGIGSGVLFDKNGDIITNNHVVAGASNIEVVIQDKNIKAKVLGADPVTDLAVIQVDPTSVKDITPAQFGDSDKLQIGEPAIAIGNPLGLAFAQTVTTGVISALKRDMPIQDAQTGQQYNETYLQTDAAINPGNSGGALCNIEGQVIGINSAKISSTGIEGIGFAIPINNALPIMQQLMTKGKISRPMLGVQIQDASSLPPQYQSVMPQDGGVYIASVDASAKSQGLQQGDIITKVDNKPVKDAATLQSLLFTYKTGDTVQVTVQRANQDKTIPVKLEERTSN